MNSKAVSFVMVAILAALILVSCSAGAGTSTQAPSGQPAALASQLPSANAPAATSGAALVEVCAMLSDAEVETASEMPVTSAEPGSVMGIFVNGCTWELDSGGEEIVEPTIQVGVISPGGREYYDKFMGPYVGEALPGVGDAAVIDDLGVITAVKGDTMVMVFVLGGDEDTTTRNVVDTILANL